ncbi:MAG TPA: protein kinase [Gemmatimonadaceae bacterium]|nr:protein kinase [Gemmatimonadaceae bacterium]
MPTSLERLRTAIADRYEIKREIGHGAMATVYLARDLKHDRDVAVKVLRDDVGFALGHERFRREIELVTHLSHPHILPIYDSGEAGSELFYVMPYVEGESLRSKLNRERQLSIDEALRITCEVASALDHSHRHGIIHRDIKPENILLEDGQALLADFGIARAAALSGEKLTSTGVSLGTPTYMSPEQGMADPNIDARTDIYSLGCVLYEMLAGQPPFTGNTTQALIARHSLDQVPSLSVVRSSVPEEVEDAILQALEKVPADRYATAHEFADALRACQVSGLHPVRRTGQRSRQINRPRARNWRVVAAVTALALLVLTGAAWASKEFLMKGRPALGSRLRAERIAVLYFKDLSPDNRLGYLANGLTESLISDLDRVSALDVISANGVKQFAGTDVSRDSISRALETGTIVDGAVESEGNQARVTYRLIDGNSGVDFKRASIVAPLGDPLTLKSNLADSIARSLREVLGNEVRVRASQAGTQNPTAWSLLQSAQKMRNDADALEKGGNVDAAASQLQAADSLLRQAQELDRNWSEPLVARGLIAAKLSKQKKDPAEAEKLLNSALSLADSALALNERDADALELRGASRAEAVARGLVQDQHKMKDEVALAEKDLRAAIEINPAQARALYILSTIAYVHQDVPEANNLAQRAYEADAYLTAAPAILFELYVTSYDLGAFAPAQRWCDLLKKRFPQNPNVGRCQLWIMTTKSASKDPDEAWRRAAEYVRLAPPQLKEYTRREAQIVVAQVLNRAGLPDSARRVLRRARTDDPAIDPRGELLGYEAFVRAQLGDKKDAVDLLQKYLTDHPEHRGGFSRANPWWWQPIQDDPRFKRLIATG